MPVMLNSMKKRDSNYCPETIRGLLSKTSCPSKLMDQQSTAVSFPIPFSCMSVLSNHLTLAMKAGSVQLARFPTLMPFHWSYNKQLQLYSKKLFDCLGHRDLKPLLQGKCPVVSNNWSFRSYHVCMREATARVETTCFVFPICLLYPFPARHFSNPWGETQEFLQKHHSEIQRPRSWAVLHSTCETSSDLEISAGARWCSQGSKMELGKATVVFPFIFLTKWKDANFGKWRHNFVVLSKLTMHKLLHF